MSNTSLIFKFKSNKFLTCSTFSKLHKCISHKFGYIKNLLNQSEVSSAIVDFIFLFRGMSFGHLFLQLLYLTKKKKKKSPTMKKQRKFLAHVKQMVSYLLVDNINFHTTCWPLNYKVHLISQDESKPQKRDLMW